MDMYSAWLVEAFSQCILEACIWPYSETWPSSDLKVPVKMPARPSSGLKIHILCRPDPTRHYNMKTQARPRPGLVFFNLQMIHNTMPSLCTSVRPNWRKKEIKKKPKFKRNRHEKKWNLPSTACAPSVWPNRIPRKKWKLKKNQKKRKELKKKWNPPCTIGTTEPKI